MFEVAHKSFCVKFSSLIAKPKILERSYSYSLLKLKKIYGAPMLKPSELFCFKDKKFRGVITFLSSMQ